MLIKHVAKLTPMKRIAYWINERETIRVAKENELPKPWTDDVILQQYRFCNIRRMDDRVSKWLLLNWYLPNRNHRNMLLACCIARLFNLPASLTAIGFPEKWDPIGIKYRVKKMRGTSANVFNAAYIVSTNGIAMDKVDYVIDRVLKPIAEAKITVHAKSIQGLWKRLKEFNGIGSFMAGQITADMRWAVDGAWIDAKTWAPLGPGSKRGMNRLRGCDINAPMSQPVFEEHLNGMIATLGTMLPSSITDRMEAIDYQSCLCEFDKYERTLLDNRKPKQKYSGT